MAAKFIHQRKSKRIAKITLLSSALLATPIMIATMMQGAANNANITNYKLAYNSILNRINDEIETSTNRGIGTYGFYNNDPKMELFFGKGATNQEYSTVNRQQFAYSTAPINATANLDRGTTIFTQQLGSLGFDVVGTNADGALATQSPNDQSAFWNPKHKRHPVVINQVRTKLQEIMSQAQAQNNPDRAAMLKEILDAPDKTMMNTVAYETMWDKEFYNIKGRELIYLKEPYFTENDFDGDKKNEYNRVFKNFIENDLKTILQEIDKKYPDAQDSAKKVVSKVTDLIVGYDPSLKVKTFDKLSASITGMNISNTNKELLASVVANKLYSLSLTVSQNNWWNLQQAIITNQEILQILQGSSNNIVTELSKKVDEIIGQFNRPMINQAPSWDAARTKARNSIDGVQLQEERQAFAMSFIESEYLAGNSEGLYKIGDAIKLENDAQRSLWDVIFNLEANQNIKTTKEKEETVKRFLKEIESLADLFYWALAANYQFTLPAHELKALGVDIAPGVIFSQNNSTNDQPPTSTTLSFNDLKTIKNYFAFRVPYDPDFENILGDLMVQEQAAQANLRQLQSKLNEASLTTGKADPTLLAVISDEQLNLYKINGKSNIILALLQLFDAVADAQNATWNNPDFANFLTIKYGVFQDIVNVLNSREAYLRQTLADQRDDVLMMMIGATEGNFSYNPSCWDFFQLLLDPVGIIADLSWNQRAANAVGAQKRSTKFNTDHLAVTESFFATISEMAVRVGYASLFQDFLDQINVNINQDQPTFAVDYLFPIYKGSTSKPDITDVKKPQLNSVAFETIVDVFYNFAVAISQSYNIKIINVKTASLTNEQKIAIIQNFIANAWKDLAIIINSAFSGQKPNWNNAQNIFQLLQKNNSKQTTNNNFVKNILTNGLKTEQKNLLELFAKHQNGSTPNLFAADYGKIISALDRQATNPNDLKFDQVQKNIKTQIQQNLLALPIAEFAYSNNPKDQNGNFVANSPLEQVANTITQFIFAGINNSNWDNNPSSGKDKLSDNLKGLKDNLIKYFTTTIKNPGQPQQPKLGWAVGDYFQNVLHQKDQLAAQEAITRYAEGFQLNLTNAVEEFWQTKIAQDTLQQYDVSGNSMFGYLILALVENQMDLNAFYMQYDNSGWKPQWQENINYVNNGSGRIEIKPISLPNKLNPNNNGEIVVVGKAQTTKYPKYGVTKEWFSDHNIALNESLYGPLEASLGAFYGALDQEYQQSLQTTDVIDQEYLGIDEQGQATLDQSRGGWLQDAGFVSATYNTGGSTSAAFTEVSAADKATYIRNTKKIPEGWFQKINFGWAASAALTPRYLFYAVKLGGVSNINAAMSMRKAFNLGTGRSLTLKQFVNTDIGTITQTLKNAAADLGKAKSTKFAKLFKKTKVQGWEKADKLVTNLTNNLKTTANIADGSALSVAKASKEIKKGIKAAKDAQKVVVEGVQETAKIKRSTKLLRGLKKGFKGVVNGLKAVGKTIVGIFKTNPYLMIASFLVEGLINFWTYQGGTFSYYQQLNSQSITGVNPIYAYSDRETMETIMNNLLLNSPYEFNNQIDESYLELIANSERFSNSEAAQSLFKQPSDRQSAKALNRMQKILANQAQSFKQGLYYNALDFGGTNSPQQMASQGKMATTFIDLQQKFDTFLQNNTSVLVEAINALGWANSAQMADNNNENNLFTLGTYDGKAAQGAGGFFVKLTTTDLLNGLTSLAVATRNRNSLSSVGIVPGSAPAENTIYTYQMNGTKANLGVQGIFGKTKAQKAFDNENRKWSLFPILGGAIAAQKANQSGGTAFELDQSEAPTIVTFPYLPTDVALNMINQANGDAKTNFQHNLFGYSALTLQLVNLPNGNAGLMINQDILDHGSNAYTLKTKDVSINLGLVALSTVNRVMVQQSSVVPAFILNQIVAEGNNNVVAKTLSTTKNLSLNLVDDLGFSTQAAFGAQPTGTKTFKIDANFKYDNSTVQKLVNDWESQIKNAISTLTKEDLHYRDPFIQMDQNTFFDQIKDTLQTIYISQVDVTREPTTDLQIQLKFAFPADIEGNKKFGLETTEINKSFTFENLKVKLGVVDKVNALFDQALSLKNSALNGRAFNIYSVLNDFKKRNQSDLKMLEDDYIVWVQQAKTKEILQTYLDLWNQWSTTAASNMDINDPSSFQDLDQWLQKVSAAVTNNEQITFTQISLWDNEFSRLLATSGLSEELALQFIQESNRLNDKYDQNYLNHNIEATLKNDYFENFNLDTTESKIRWLAQTMELGYANNQVMVDKYNHDNTNESKDINLEIAASDIFSIVFNSANTIFANQDLNVTFTDQTNKETYVGKPQADGSYIWSFAATNYNTALTFTNFNTVDGQAIPKEYLFRLDATKIDAIDAIFNITIKQQPSTFADVAIKNNTSTDYLVEFPYTKQYLLTWSPDIQNLPPYYQWSEDTFKTLQNNNQLPLLFSNNPDEIVLAAFKRNNKGEDDAEVIAYQAAMKLNDPTRWQNYVIENPFQIFKTTKNVALQTINDIYVAQSNNDFKAADAFYISSTNTTVLNTWQPTTFLDVTFLQQRSFSLQDQLNPGDKIVYGKVQTNVIDKDQFGLIAAPQEIVIKEQTNLTFNLNPNTLYKFSISKQIDNEIVWFNKYVFYSQEPIINLADTNFKTNLLQNLFKTSLFQILPFDLSSTWFNILHTQRLIGQGSTAINLENQIREFSLSQILALVRNQITIVDNSKQNALEESIRKRDLISKIKKMITTIQSDFQSNIFNQLEQNSLDSYLALFNTSQLQALETSISETKAKIESAEKSIDKNNSKITTNTNNLALLNEAFSFIQALTNINNNQNGILSNKPTEYTDLLSIKSDSWVNTTSFLNFFTSYDQDPEQADKQSQAKIAKSKAFWELVKTRNGISQDKDDIWIKQTMINILNQALVNLLESKNEDIISQGTTSGVDQLKWESVFQNQKTVREIIDQWSKNLKQIIDNKNDQGQIIDSQKPFFDKRLSAGNVTNPIINWNRWQNNFDQQENFRNQGSLLKALADQNLDLISATTPYELNLFQYDNYNKYNPTDAVWNPLPTSPARPNTVEPDKFLTTLQDTLTNSSLTDSIQSGYAILQEVFDENGQVSYKIGQIYQSVNDPALRNQMYINLERVRIKTITSNNQTIKKVTFLDYDLVSDPSFPFQPPIPTFNPGDPDGLIQIGSNKITSQNKAKGLITIGLVDDKATFLKNAFQFHPKLIAPAEGNKTLMDEINNDKIATDFIKDVFNFKVKNPDPGKPELSQFFVDQKMNYDGKTTSLGQLKALLQSVENKIDGQMSLKQLDNSTQIWISELSKDNQGLEAEIKNKANELRILRQDLTDFEAQKVDLITSGKDIYAMLGTIFSNNTKIYNQWLIYPNNGQTFLENLLHFKAFLEQEQQNQTDQTDPIDQAFLAKVLKLVEELIAIEEDLQKISQIPNPMFYQSTNEHGIMRDIAAYLLTNVRLVSFDDLMSKFLGITNWKSHIGAAIEESLQKDGRWTFEQIKDFDDTNQVLWLQGSVQTKSETQLFIMSIPWVNLEQINLDRFVIYWAKPEMSHKEWKEVVLASNLQEFLANQENAQKYFKQNLAYDPKDPAFENKHPATIANSETKIFKSQPQLNRYLFINKVYEAKIDFINEIANKEVYESALNDFRSFLLTDLSQMVGLDFHLNDPKYKNLENTLFQIKGEINDNAKTFTIEALNSAKTTFTYSAKDFGLTDQQWTDVLKILKIKSTLNKGDLTSAATLSNEATMLLKPLITHKSQLLSLSMADFTKIVLPNLGLQLKTNYNDVFLTNNKNLLAPTNSVLLKLSHNNNQLDSLENEQYVFLRLQVEISAIGLEPWKSNEFNVLIKKAVNINNVITTTFDLNDFATKPLFEQLNALMSQRMADGFISTFELKSSLTNSNQGQKLNQILASLLAQAPYIAQTIPNTENATTTLLDIKDANGKIISLDYKVVLFRSLLSQATSAKLANILAQSNPSNGDLVNQIKQVLIDDQILNFDQSAIVPEGFVNNTLSHLYGAQFVSTPDFSNLMLEIVIKDPNDPIKRSAKTKGQLTSPLNFDGQSKYVVFAKDRSGTIYITTSLTPAQTRFGDLIQNPSTNYHLNNALIKSILPQMQALYDQMIATVGAVYEAKADQPDQFVLNKSKVNNVEVNSKVIFALDQEDVKKSTLISQEEFLISKAAFDDLTSGLNFDQSLSSINNFLHQFANRLVKRYTGAPSNAVSVVKTIKKVANQYLLVVDSFSGTTYNTFQFALDVNLANSPITSTNWNQLGIKNQSVIEIQALFSKPMAQDGIQTLNDAPAIRQVATNPRTDVNYVDLTITGNSAFGNKNEQVQMSNAMWDGLQPELTLPNIPLAKEKVAFFQPWMWGLLSILTLGIGGVALRYYLRKRSYKSTKQVS